MEKKVLLFSGGFDSMLQEWLIKPDVLLYVDMKTSYSEREIEALQLLPTSYKERLIIKELPLGEYERDNKYLPYRNLILGAIAMQYGQHVYFGFNNEDWASDKDTIFLDKTTSLFKHLNERAVWDMGWDNFNFSFNAPFKKYSKTEMVREALKAGMPVELIQQTRSCYDGESKIGCGICNVCVNKAIALLLNDIYSPELFDHPITLEQIETRIEDARTKETTCTKKHFFELQKAAKKLRCL